MRVIGITGNSGSGKSEVCNILLDAGGYVLNADKIGHRILYKDGIAYNEVVDLFGKDILDNEDNINRKKLANIVFTNKHKLKELTSITHKYILSIIIKELEKLNKTKNEYKFIAIDAPLLIESGLNKYVDEVWLVYAKEDTRLNRIINRDNINRYEALNRTNSQTMFENLREHADVLIDNSSSLEALKMQVYSLISNL